MIAILWAFLFLLPESGDNSALIRRMEKDKVHWADFQGSPDMASQYDAQVYSGIHYSFSYQHQGSNTALKYEVHSFINPALSWSKREKQSAELLAHEQLHYDISELYARKMRKALASYKLSKHAKADIEKLFNRINTERKRMQAKYDAETEHSKNRPAQKSWELFVASELWNLNNYQ